MPEENENSQLHAHASSLEESSSSTSLPWLKLGQRAEYEIAAEAHDVFSKEEGHVNMIIVCGIVRSGKSYLLNALMDQHVFGVSDQATRFTSGVDICPCLLPLCQVGGHASSRSPKISFVDMEGQGHNGIKQDLRLATPLLITSKIVILNEVCPASAVLERLKVIMCAAQCVAKRQERRALFGCLHIVLRDSTQDEEECHRVIFCDEDPLQVDTDEKEQAMNVRNDIRAAIKLAFESIRVWCLPRIMSTVAPPSYRDAGAAYSEKIDAMRQEMASQLAMPKLLDGHPLTGSTIAALLPQIAEAMKSEQPALSPSLMMDHVLHVGAAVFIDNLLKRVRSELQVVRLSLPMAPDKILQQAKMIKNRYAEELEVRSEHRGSVLFMQEFDDTIAELQAQNHQCLTRLAMELPVEPGKLQSEVKHGVKVPVPIGTSASTVSIRSASTVFSSLGVELADPVEIWPVQLANGTEEREAGCCANADASVATDEARSEDSPQIDDRQANATFGEAGKFSIREQIGRSLAGEKISCEHMVTSDTPRFGDRNVTLASLSGDVDTCNHHVGSKAAETDAALATSYRHLRCRTTETDAALAKLSGEFDSCNRHLRSRAAEAEAALALQTSDFTKDFSESYDGRRHGTDTTACSLPSRSLHSISYDSELEPDNIMWFSDELESYDGWCTDEFKFDKEGATRIVNELSCEMLGEDSSMTGCDDVAASPIRSPRLPKHEMHNQVGDSEALEADASQCPGEFDYMGAADENSDAAISERSVLVMLHHGATFHQEVADEFEEQRCTPQYPFWVLREPPSYGPCPRIAPQLSHLCQCPQDDARGDVVLENEQRLEFRDIVTDVAAPRLSHFCHCHYPKDGARADVVLDNTQRLEYRDWIRGAAASHHDVAASPETECRSMPNDIEADPPVYSRPKPSRQSGHHSQWPGRIDACSDSQISVPFAARASEVFWQSDEFSKKAKHYLRESAPEDMEFWEDSLSERYAGSLLVSADSLGRGPSQPCADSDDLPAFGDDHDKRESSSLQSFKRPAVVPLGTRWSI